MSFATPRRNSVSITAECRKCGRDISKTWPDASFEFPWFHTETGDTECVTVECDRHGGPWGGDLTCIRCMDDDGNIRPTPDTDEGVQCVECGGMNGSHFLTCHIWSWN